MDERTVKVTIPMDDRLDAEVVAIQVDTTGKLWININERCAIRIGHVKALVLDFPAGTKLDALGHSALDFAKD